MAEVAMAFRAKITTEWDGEHPRVRACCGTRHRSTSAAANCAAKYLRRQLYQAPTKQAGYRVESIP